MCRSNELSIIEQHSIVGDKWWVQFFAGLLFILAATTPVVSVYGQVRADNPVLTATQSGGLITVQYSSLSAPTNGDWIGLYMEGASIYSHADWKHTGGGVSGTQYFSVSSSGPWIVRLFRNGGYTSVASTTVATSNSSPSNGALSANPGAGAISVSWNISGPTGGDWLGVYREGTVDLRSHYTWAHTNGLASGTISIPVAQQGRYFAVFFRNGNYTEVYRTGSVMVTAGAPPPTMTVAQPTQTPLPPAPTQAPYVPPTPTTAVATATPYVAPTINTPVPPSNGWNCTVGVENGGHLWMRSFHGGNQQFAWRIGAGGVIDELRDVGNGSVTLLAPPSHEGNRTDRVIQGTLWNGGLKVSPDEPGTLNTTQAGTGEDLLTPTLYARYKKTGSVCSVSVLSHMKDQWKKVIEKHFKTSVPILTTYDFAGGILTITRELLIESVKKDGKDVGSTDYYFEGWSPFSADQFNALALSVDSNGQPNHWYAARQNIKDYPNIEFSATRGWALLYRIDRMTSGTVIGLAYGTAPSTGQLYRRLNMMDFGGNIAILPSVKHMSAPVGAMITQQLKLYMTRGIAKEMGAIMDGVARSVEQPQFIFPSASHSTRMQKVRTLLESVPSVQGTRTDRIGTLATSGELDMKAQRNKSLRRKVRVDRPRRNSQKMMKPSR